MHKAAESLAVYYAVAVALKIRADSVRGQGLFPAAAFRRKRRIGRKGFALALFAFFTKIHFFRPPSSKYFIFHNVYTQKK